MMVVDASVAVKWFLNEKFSEDALALLTVACKPVAPTLAAFEVSGAITRACLRNDIDGEHMSACRDRWLHMMRTSVIRLELDQRDMVRGSEISLLLKHPLADCIYLAMAERLKTTLVTADSVFFDKAKGHFANVYFIADALNHFAEYV